jgi:hypothetical protein
VPAQRLSATSSIRRQTWALALDAYKADYPAIQETVLEAFRQLVADSARRLQATHHAVPPEFEDAVVQEVLDALPTPELLRSSNCPRTGIELGIQLIGETMRRSATPKRTLAAWECADRASTGGATCGGAANNSRPARSEPAHRWWPDTAT